MQFTYKIEEYIQPEKRFFVTYIPEDTSLKPYSAWVYINDDMTEQQIKERIIKSVPLKYIEPPNNPLAQSLVGVSEVASYSKEQMEADNTPEFLPSNFLDLRILRNNALFQSDWSQLDDSPLSAEEKQKYAEYRQALRDLPQQEGFPNVSLPEKADFGIV